MLCRSHIAVIFSITTFGISISGTTLTEGQRFHLIQFSKGGKIIKFEGIYQKLYKTFTTKNTNAR
jgi:hypothetical protein